LTETHSVPLSMHQDFATTSRMASLSSTCVLCLVMFAGFALYQSLHLVESAIKVSAL